MSRGVGGGEEGDKEGRGLHRSKAMIEWIVWALNVWRERVGDGNVGRARQWCTGGG